MTGHRILTIASAHPEFNAGGSETAAYALHNAYAASADVEAALFLARHDRGDGATGRLSPLRAGEYLWEQTIRDWFVMQPAHLPSLFRQFSDLLRQFRPTIVHLHSYAHLGLDVIRLIKRVDPDIRIIVTLHEYLAICFNQGQMIKTGTRALCRAEGLEVCHRCFPDRTPEDFWLRKNWFQRNFSHVDLFVSPSAFLRQRYVDWGIAPDRIAVIENAIESAEKSPSARTELPPNRFGFFGQITPYKGVDTLLQGIAAMPRKRRRALRLEINAANLDQQTPEFQDRINGLMTPLIADGVVQWNGPYDAHEKAQRFQSVDWVVVPSLWWENSPMVIQEAFANARPVLCSDIGGMAEKVTDGVDGRHVATRNAGAWGDILSELAGNADAWATLSAGITAPPPPGASAARHLAALGDITPGARRAERV